MPRSVIGEATYKQVIERSEFVGYAAAVFSDVDVKTFVNAIKNKHPRASHHVWAYRLGSTTYYTDAGEPSGSAGLPVLNAIREQNLDYICVVVVRYFGGVLLGVKGLIEAYHSTACKVLETAYKGEVLQELEVQVEMDYAAHGRLYERLSVLVRDMGQQFDEKVHVSGWVASSDLDVLKQLCLDGGAELFVADGRRWAVR